MPFGRLSANDLFVGKFQVRRDSLSTPVTPDVLGPAQNLPTSTNLRVHMNQAIFPLTTDYTYVQQGKVDAQSQKSTSASFHIFL